MSFNDDAGLDTSQVEDARGGGGIPGGGIAVGGGAGLLLLVLGLIFGVNPADLGGGAGQSDPGDNASISQECRSGADANRRQDCRIVGYVNSVQGYWQDEFARRGGQYRAAPTRLFDGSVQTGCGGATSAVGPFYCPPDTRVYIDLSFFSELQTRFGAKGGPFAEAYVVAHEYGHHVQNLTGQMDKVGSDREGPQSGSVRLELQADCLAGVWANHAAQTTDRQGRRLIQPLTQEQIAAGLDAAAAVGDDRIQEKAQGRVDPESWTHGSAEQRQKWFTIGYQKGDLNACDTFSGAV
jgi:predicted metalloprotease